MASFDLGYHIFNPKGASDIPLSSQHELLEFGGEFKTILVDGKDRHHSPRGAKNVTYSFTTRTHPQGKVSANQKITSGLVQKVPSH